ncbi:hypothetical protein SAMN06265784_12340 [Paraburkholderia susongensis]|uniref:Uncharacterized protein n=1 Tax=Paraburkholderia susongensis TaxID=1515439 RepID=A0A1X7M6H4_9BURK|nr:hypothetical protein SAMN06265784_12340 [Paraburkholderia susongensis]
MTKIETTEPRLSTNTYALLSIMAGGIGATSAVVTAQFFVLCLQHLEVDPRLRSSASAAGVTMIVAELLVFGVAGMLPRVSMRALRRRLIVLGCVLLGFEVTTMSTAQIAMNQAAAARADATATHITALRDSMTARREALRSLRTSAERQSESRHSWERVGGANSLKDVLEAQSVLDAQARELANAESVAAAPTSSEVLGKPGMIAFSIARALLLASIGAVMFGAAGALMRARREHSTASTRDRAPASPIPPLNTADDRFATAATAPAASIALEAIASMQLPTAVAAINKVHEEPVHVPVPVSSQVDAETFDAACEAHDARFAATRDAVRSGRVKPSLRALYRFCGASQGVATRYLARLEQAGDIERAGRGYVRCTRTQLTAAL